MPAHTRGEGPSRRQFHRQAALLAAAPLVAASDALAQPQPANQKTVEDAANALVEVAKAQYGKHLDEQQLKALARSVHRTLLSAERMKLHSLRNGEEPAFLVPFDQD